MSGSSAAISCTNAFPNAQEATRVNTNFATLQTIGPRAYEWVTAGA
jgi:snapalysin